jgi:hypothetical protein
VLIPVTRNRLIVILAALVVPGGLVALASAALFRALARTERGRRALVVARRGVPAWASGGLGGRPDLRRAA